MDFSQIWRTLTTDVYVFIYRQCFVIRTIILIRSAEIAAMSGDKFAVMNFADTSDETKWKANINK